MWHKQLGNDSLSEYRGCVNITSPSQVSFTGLAHNSLTQCSQLCLGTGVATYAAVGPTDCHCYTELPNFTPLTSECNSACVGVASQMCGGISGTNTVYNLLQIGNRGNVVTVFWFLLKYLLCLKLL